MLKVGQTIQLNASDLVGHLNCRNLTELDLAVAKGVLAKPKVWSPLVDVLRERGIRHEQGYIDHLRVRGLERPSEILPEDGDRHRQNLGATSPHGVASPERQSRAG